MTVKHLDHLNLSVRNFEETAVWYRRVFGFEIVESGLWRGRPWGVLKSGEALLCVYQLVQQQAGAVNLPMGVLKNTPGRHKTICKIGSKRR